MSRKIKRIIVDYTTLSAWRKCPTYFKYRYLDALSKIVARAPQEQPKRGSALEFGRLIHEGLELWYSGEYTWPDLWQKIYFDAVNTELVNVDPSGDRNIPHLEELLNAYIRKYPAPDVTPLERDGQKMLEHRFELTLSPTVTYRGHLDALVEQVDGTVAVLEHKTASGNPLAGFSDRTLPNDQAVGYSLGAASLLGLPTVPVLFNGLSSDRNAISEIWREAQRARAEKNPSRYRMPFDPFLRVLVHITPEHHAEWKAGVLRDCRRLVEDIEENAFSRNAPDACTVFNRRCAFDDLCKFTGDSRKSMLEFTYETIEPWKGFTIEWETE